MMDYINLQNPSFQVALIAILATSVLMNLVWLKRCFTKPDVNQQQQRLNKKRRMDRLKTYPKQYPAGWYRVCDSDEVKKGETKHICYLGNEMVAFRGENGTLSVMDAYCPHLGANLAFGGKVVGNSIQCPFHLWEFGTDGQCTHIPYCDKAPKNAQIFTYPCVERYGMVMIWYHPNGDEPHYEAISIPDLDVAGDYSFRGKYSYPDIKMHLQEFIENSADSQHFGPIHGTMCIPWTNIEIPFIKINHLASFSLSEEPHVANFFDTANLNIFGRKMPSSVTAKVTFYGPGSITLFQFDGKFGRIYLFHTHTPSSFTNLDVKFLAFVQWKIPRPLSWYIVGSWITQWQRDIIIWENKIHHRVPLLVKGDGPIMKMRRWYKQFYIQKEADELDW